MTATNPCSADRRVAQAAGFDINKVREQFPILNVKVHGKDLVYLDNANTSQKPKGVVAAQADYYYTTNSNIHRGIYHLSEQSTKAYEVGREKARVFINAKESAELVFVRGTTEGINLVASSFLRPRLKAGDEILISTMEHHSNIVPWQLVCEATGAKLRIIPISDDGEILLDEYGKLLSEKTKFVSLVHASNTLGTINPIKKMVQMAHSAGAPVLVDGAQSTPHLMIDVQDLDCDFFAFSSHKTFGPMGIGVLYGKREHLDAMPPYQGGGDMIRSVTFEKTTYNELPYKFEAGTPNVAGVVGLGAAIDYMMSLGRDAAEAYELDLLRYATNRIKTVPGIRIIGNAANKVSVISFLLESAHPHDIGTILDRDGIAIRAGHHCTQPLMKRYGVAATARASFAFYNTREEADALVAALHKVNEMFK